MTYSIGNITIKDSDVLTNTISLGAYPYGYTSVTGATGAIPPGGYTMAGANGTSGAWVTASTDIKGASLNVKGDADFEGDVTIKGRSIVDMLTKIEQRLALLTPDTRLESEWEELKALGDQYRALEKHILEKSKTWDILKKE